MHTILLTTLNAKYIHMNLAIRLLYALNKHHENLSWQEFTIKNDPEEVAQACAKYHVVCFSCYIWNITQTLVVAEKIKAINPHCKVLLGGPEVSYDWQEVIVHDAVDYIVVGEGELPFAAFISDYPKVSHIPNIAYKEKGTLQFNGNNDMFDILQLENINPYTFEPKEDIANKVSYIETSRGCPYKCEFCLASLDNKVRYLPIATIKENLLYLMQHGKVIKFLDRTFNIKRDFTIDIFEFILQHHKPDNVFQFEITADILHPDIIKFIQEKIPPGLFRFEIGIQTVNQKANLEVSRKQNFDKTKSIIEQVRNYVDLHLDLIVGLPLDYWADIKYSFEEVFKLYPPELQLGFLKFLRGTPVRAKSALHGYKYHATAPYQIIESNYLSKAELEQIVVVEEALEIYWNKDRTRNLLKYVAQQYSSFDFLLALGNYFEQRSNFHKHTLKDIYLLAFEFCKTHYPQDILLQELISIDFYSAQKIKPAFYLMEPLDKTHMFKIIATQQLNHHQYKYLMLPLSFDMAHWEQHTEIIPESTLLCVEYNGKQKPMIKSLSKKELV